MNNKDIANELYTKHGNKALSEFIYEKDISLQSGKYILQLEYGFEDEPPWIYASGDAALCSIKIEDTDNPEVLYDASDIFINFTDGGYYSSTLELKDDVIVDEYGREYAMWKDGKRITDIPKAFIEYIS